MATIQTVVPIELPEIPVAIKDFIPYYSSHPRVPASEILQPFKSYESQLRKVYAQHPQHETLRDGLVNAVPIFAGLQADLKIRARNLEAESAVERDRFIMPLDASERKPDGSPAVVQSLKEFQHNFNLFSESALGDLDWSNVLAAGSAVVTSLLPVPQKWAGSKRALREYYHEHLAPASDVDLFLYGLNEEEAVEKIKQIETRIKDSILHETTTIRTKNAITIASQYPTRHVQIVLRLYDSISQVITGFDVDCACVAYDGKQVYGSPRALIAFATQVNTIDLSRRSPSYENRLSKYSHRGFEVHWPLLDRSKIDPTIFERSFNRTMGLARLLVLEKLPKRTDRDAYSDLRRVERGRPPANRAGRDQHRLWGNIKEQEEDDVAEWVEAEEVSDYHTMVVPYGKRFNAAKINKLLYTKDLLLNAEWNKPKDRDVHLHRHPCFFGDLRDVIEDCCGFCPVPETEEEFEAAKEENRLYISGNLKFITDDPGRQEIGSFNPITSGDWSEMAIVGNTQMLCQAIVDGDVDYVRSWCGNESNDVNCRDYVGRTPLHLAITSSTLEIVQCLIDNGARMVARLVDGRTSLHLAAAAGKVDMVKALMQKSLANQEEEDEKQARLSATTQTERRAEGVKPDDHCESESELSDPDDFDDSEAESDSDHDSVTMGSFVKVKPDKESGNDIPEDNMDDPDIFDIDVLAWDFQTSPLHLAIVNGHVETLRTLVEEYGADVLLPIKHMQTPYSPPNAILTLVLALSLPMAKAKEVVRVLLELGASSSQADIKEFTAFHYMVSENKSEILDVLFEEDGPAAHAVLNSVTSCCDTAITLALRQSRQDMVTKLLSMGAKSTIGFEEYMRVVLTRNEHAKKWSPEYSKDQYSRICCQPVILAAQKEMPMAIQELIAKGADMTSIDQNGYMNVKDHSSPNWRKGSSLLDIVRSKIEKLKEYSREKLNVQTPETLKDEDYYTQGLKSGTYEHWKAVSCFRAFKMKNDKARNLYNEQWKVATSKQSGAQEKMEAITKLLEDFEKLEVELVHAGAKTFEELHPTVPKGSNPNMDFGFYKPITSQPFATSITFTVPDLTDQKKAAYVRLFEAVWIDDPAAVKVLTLESWKSPSDDIEHPPLTIAVRDKDGFSPFSLAVLRGHLHLAKAILEIALAQYEPPEDLPGRRERWAINADAEDSSSGSDSDAGTIGPNIYSTIVDDNYTIENVTEISNIVRSHVDPLTMVEWPCMAHWFSDNKSSINNEKPLESQISLLKYAVYIDDMALLKYLLKICAEQQARTFTEDGTSQAYSVNIDIYYLAIEFGRVAMLSELIKATGVGIPLDVLVEKSGVVVQDKPRYYQGLSIAGKKNLNWAKRGRDRHVSSVHLTDSKPPLFKAAGFGSLDSVRWFLSDAPLQKYTEFAAANRGNKKVSLLAQSKDGFEVTIRNWLKSTVELTLHSAVRWNPTEKNIRQYEELVTYLLTALPNSIEHKSPLGLTPLHVAVAVRRPQIVKLLLSAGANSRAVDRYGRNVIHNMVVGNPHLAISSKSQTVALTNPKQLEAMITLFKEKDVKEMLLERCSIPKSNLTGLTPLGYWMAKNSQNPPHGSTGVIEILARYSEGDDMDLINGGGDLPLHQAVKQGLPAITEFLISVRPPLLHRENATGRTPLDLASDMFLQEQVTKGPAIGNIAYNSHYSNTESSITSKAPSEFLPTPMVNGENKSTKLVYEVCVEAAKRYPGKRKLVSLFEANEVTKRLAGRKNRVQSFTDQESDEESM